MKKEIVGGVVLLVVLFLGMFAASYIFQWTTAPWIGELEKKQQTEGSGEWKRVTYNRFFDKCATIKGNYESLQTQKEYLSELDKSSDEWYRVRQTVAGLEQQIKRDIEDYNVDVQKDYTKAIMYDHDLPYRITFDELERGEVQCS